MYYIGIDLGGTNIAVGLVSEDGKILRKAETPTLAKRPYADIVHDMAACVAKLLDEAKLTTQDIAAIGIGIPGIAEQKTGRVIFCTNLGWRNIPLRDELKSYYDLPIFIDNDATVAGWAEYQAGVSRNTSSSVFLTLGTGVGAGIVVDGKIWSGAHGAASELGHLIIEVDGIPCTCGKCGCTDGERATANVCLDEGGKVLSDGGLRCHEVLLSTCLNDSENIRAGLLLPFIRKGSSM